MWWPKIVSAAATLTAIALPVEMRAASASSEQPTLLQDWPTMLGRIAHLDTPLTHVLIGTSSYRS
jgi:hypothetical protein